MRLICNESAVRATNSPFSRLYMLNRNEVCVDCLFCFFFYVTGNTESLSSSKYSILAILRGVGPTRRQHCKFFQISLRRTVRAYAFVLFPE